MTREQDEISQKWSEFSVLSEYDQRTPAQSFEGFKKFKEAISTLPKGELLKRGWIDTKDDVSSLFSLYRDYLAGHGLALYRKSDDANVALTALWLSKVKSQAEVEYFVKRPSQFSGLSAMQLKDIAQLSTDVNEVDNLPLRLLDYGILLIFLPHLPSMKLDGVVFKLKSGTPVIGMSLRYSRLDYFWFTLMHELSHIQLHMDILDNPILDDFDVESDSDIEIAANRLAKNSFVDRRVWRNCEPKYDKSYDAIDKFAEKIGIHRSIVAGMLRREFGNYAAYSKIVNEYDVREIIFNAS